MSNYFHITVPDAWEEIQSNGLICDDEGYIFLLNTDFPAVVNYVAFNQILFKYGDYILLEVDYKGINKPLIRDKVAEAPAYLGHQWILKQERISKRHLKFIYKKTLTKKVINVSRDLLYNKLGWEMYNEDIE